MCAETRQERINELKRAFAYNLFYGQGATPRTATVNDYFLAVAGTIRDRMQHLFINSVEALLERESKIVSYLSAEFLMGPHLANNLVNLGLFDEVREAARQSGLDLAELMEHEEEPGLGNGGLGRLAACYLDSLSTLQIPAIGYGIRYEYGMFDQEIVDGWQKEISDRWLHPGNPWEIKKPDLACDVGFGGQSEVYHDSDGNRRMRWLPARVVTGVPYDTPIPGYRTTSTCSDSGVPRRTSPLILLTSTLAIIMEPWRKKSGPRPLPRSSIPMMNSVREKSYASSSSIFLFPVPCRT